MIYFKERAKFLAGVTFVTTQVKGGTICTDWGSSSENIYVDQLKITRKGKVYSMLYKDVSDVTGMNYS